MATQERGGGGKGLFEQDPHVEQLRPDPSAPPSDVVILEGLAGKSDREGWARLYFNRTLTYYAEFRREDILFTQSIPPDQSPIPGLKATRVGIKKDAVIEYTRTTRAKVADEFDLDVQLGGIAPQMTQPPSPAHIVGSAVSCGMTCAICTIFGTCQTCPGQTCRTCDTQCVRSCGGTCVRSCGGTCGRTCTCGTQCQ